METSRLTKNINVSELIAMLRTQKGTCKPMTTRHSITSSARRMRIALDNNSISCAISGFKNISFCRNLARGTMSLHEREESNIWKQMHRGILDLCFLSVTNRTTAPCVIVSCER